MNSTHPLVWLAVGIAMVNLLELVGILIQRRQYRQQLAQLGRDFEQVRTEITCVAVQMHGAERQSRLYQLRIKELEAALRDANASFLNLMPHGEPGSPDACWAYGPIQRQMQAASDRIISVLYGDEPFGREPNAPKAETFIEHMQRNGMVEGPRYRTNFDDIKRDYQKGE
jgi:heme exporter protein D